MKRVQRIVVVVSLICLAAAPCLWAALPEFPQGWVSDFAGILSEDTRNQINGLIDEVKSSTGAEIAVVTVSSLDGMTVEGYAVRLFEKWGIGMAEEDNGVLFLIAPNERKTRIEVGYGLEPVITDGRAGEIIRETILPFFRAGDYDQGVLQGSRQIAALITGKDFVPSVPIPETEPQGDDTPWPLKIGIMLFFALFITLGFLALGYALRNKKGRGFFLIWGTGFGGIPLFMSIVFGLTIGFPIFILPVWALIVLIIGICYGKKLFPMTMSSGGRTYSSSGSSFGGFSGGSSFGGFSGGSSGGGGASGSW